MTPKQIVQYFQKDIWMSRKGKLPRPLSILENILKTFILALKAFVDARITSRASALSFSSLLAIVPLAAVVFGVARGFGFSKYIEDWFLDMLSTQPQVAETIIGFVNSYLVNVKSGVILGFGIVVMLYTTIMLISNIEDTFNDIWHVRDSRGWMSTIIDYVAFIVLLPFALILISGINIFISSTYSNLNEYVAPIVKLALTIAPFFVISIMFIVIYKVMPNTKVRFASVVWPGILAGVAMQILQLVYIHLQLWASSYNAIYGSFAALPLFMLWVQFSWIICLFGVHLCYTNQNMERLMPVSYNEDISHQYRMRLSAMLLSAICKRFEKGEKPYTPLKLMRATGIPTHIVADLLKGMEKAGLIVDVTGGNRDLVPAYMPAMDIAGISVGVLIDRLESLGDWNLDEVSQEELDEPNWRKVIDIRADYLGKLRQVSITDLETS